MEYLFLKFKIQKYVNFFLFLCRSIFVFLFLCANVLALTERIFFVGEDVKVLTIASKKIERPSEAPAIAQVVTSSEWKAFGIRTLGELLSWLSGFYINPVEWGSRVFIRGIGDGILFLYDGVPLTSDSTKSLQPLDEDLSLDNLARVEIIKGPASFIWGPDAFGGVINLVPKSGDDKKFLFNFKVLGGGPEKDRSINLEIFPKITNKSTFIGVSYYIKSFFKNNYHFSLAHKTRSGSVGYSEFYEGVFSLKDKNFSITARISNSNENFILKDFEGASWPAERNFPLSFIKGNWQKRFGKTTLVFNTYFSYFRQKLEELALVQEQKNFLWYGEALLHREFNERKGYLTLGISYRHNKVRDATINVRGYFPSYLQASNKQFKPLLDTANFDTYLSSFFAQIRYLWFDSLGTWLGVRFDNHNQYSNTFSYQLGFQWIPSRNFYAKILWGTSYRTPYSMQFLGRRLESPEEIRTLAAEMMWQKGAFRISFTPYYSRISHHITEDPYGGYSIPARRYFLGGELSFRVFKEGGRFWTDLSWHNDWGEEERYRVLDYILLFPGHPPQPHYSFYEKPYLSSPKWIFNFGFARPLPAGFEIFGRLQYQDIRRFYFLKIEKEKTFGPAWIVDFGIRKCFGQDTVFTLAFKNILDTRYHSAGTYSPIQAPRFSVYLWLERHW